MRRAGSFPGAACQHPIELPTYKAAPLQALAHPFSLIRFIYVVIRTVLF